MNARAGGAPPGSDSGEARRLEAGISVVVPCYNSERTLPELLRQLAAVLPSCSGSYEVILVNDGSGDRTWQSILDLAATYPWIRGIDLMRNYGQHNATLCGVRAARFDITVTLDDDLQNPPSEIPKLLKEIERGQELVYGTPSHRSHSPLRNAASWLARRSIELASGPRLIRSISAFRAFRTELRRAFAEYRSPEVILDVLLAWGTTRVTSVVVHHEERAVGASNYGLLRLLSTLVLLWTSYTTLPLRLASWLGFACVLFGAAVLCYVVGVYFQQGSLPGFPFLASTIAIFGGVQLFALGIFGEYLARLFNRSLDRPTYTARGDESGFIGETGADKRDGPPR